MSFITIPPVNRIKHLSKLALVVESCDYHCISYQHTAVKENWKNSKREHLKIIARNNLKNKLSYEFPFENFVCQSRKQNLAYFLETKFISSLDGQL